MGGDSYVIPILYEANETQFNHGGLGTLSDAISVFPEEERNGKFELIIEYPIFGKLFNELKNDRIIKVDASHRLKNQRFKIIRITKPMKGIVKVLAEHVSYLSQDLALNPTVSYSGNAQQALQQWANNIVDNHPFSVWSNISHFAEGLWTIDKVENPRRALGGVAGSILNAYGGEYLFDNYDIRLYQSRGVDNGVRISYGKNLVDLEQEEEISSTYTSVYPYVVDEDENVLTLPEIYVDSEHVGKYARRKILAVDFSQEEITTVEQLRSRTQQYIEQNDVGIPKVNIKIKFIDLAHTLEYKELLEVEDIGLCDWVTVDFEKLGIKRKAKIIRTKWNGSLNRYEELEIGEVRASLSKAINAPMEERLDNVNQMIGNVRRQANKKNTTFDQSSEPSGGDYNNGDQWLRPIEDGHYELYVWDGQVWSFILSTADTDSNKKAIEEQQAAIQEVRESSDWTIDQINQALQDTDSVDLRELFARKIGEDDFGTLFYQNAESVGLVYEEDGDLKAIIAIQDGVPYIKGEHIILDGNTIVDGSFTVTEEMIAPNAVLDHLKASGIDASEINVINLNMNSLSGGDIELSKGFRITNNGQEVLSIDAQTGRTVFNAPDIATKEDLENIELTPGPEGPPGPKGETGDVGPQGPGGSEGPAGVGISSMSVEYYLSTSSNSQSGGSWSSNAPTWVDGRYMWTRTRTTFSDGATETSNPVNVTGSRGPTGSQGPAGATGDTGRGVSSLQEEYYLSTSKAELSDGSWSTNPPTWENGTYVWTRIRINLSNPSGIDYTTPIVNASWEAIDDVANSKADQATVEELDESLSNLETITATREELGEILSTLSDYRDMLEANEIDVNDAKDDISDLLGRIPLIESNLGEWVEQWNFLETYVRLGDEGLLIQEMNGATGIRITNNRIDFLDGRGEPVAYITNQVMRINRGIFVDSAQIGEHKIETIAGGHTTWQWMG